MSPRGRRVQGEGSIFQKCETRYGCPPKQDGTRPRHNCRGRWFAVVDLGPVGGRRVRKTVSAATKKELLPKFNALRAEVSSGVITSDNTVAEWMTYWLDNVVGRRNRPSTMRNYRSKSDNWIVKHLGAYRLAKLQPQHIRALYQTMEDQGKAASVKHVHTLLGSALEQAVKDRVLPYNPVRSVVVTKVEKVQQPKFTLVEAQMILRALDGHPEQARWTVALLSGLRQGEALGLRWEDVDLDAGTLRVERAAQRVTGQGIVLVKPKTLSSVRTRPMVAPVAFALAAMPGPRAGFVFGDGDKPLDQKADSLRWHAMLEAAGAPDKPLKAARATTASLLMEAGVPPKVIAEIMGHAQVATTEGFYMMGDDSQYRAANRALEQLLALG